jgi:hypothetical protein
LVESYLIETEHDHFGFDPLNNYTSNIFDAKYDKVDVRDVAQEQTHLTGNQRNDLERLLKKNTKSSSVVNLGYIHKKNELLSGAEPMHTRPCPVPRIHEDTL